MDPILVTLRVGATPDPPSGEGHDLEGADHRQPPAGAVPADPARRVCAQCGSAVLGLSAPFPVGRDQTTGLFRLSGEMFCSLGCVQLRNLQCHGGTQHYWQVSGWLHHLAGGRGVICPREGAHGTVSEIPPHVISCRDSCR